MPQNRDALFEAILDGDKSLEKVRHFLADGADPNALEPAMLWSAFHWAIRSQQYALVDVLIAHGANIHLPTCRQGYSPLHLAAEANDVPLIEQLSALGADLEARDHRGRTPFMLATDAAALSALVRWGADVDAQDEQGYSVLHHAARANNEDLVFACLVLGANAHLKNEDGVVPAMLTKSAEIARLLDYPTVAWILDGE
ncbi:ankyrin repeat domain-containing protein [Luteimonas dalianensis]|uniref:ankyrin repeat domain-containing protein n=1 Tax=Luteimonas dalianensis TaxID=1148196 RepID=UPI003BF07D5B